MQDLSQGSFKPFDGWPREELLQFDASRADQPSLGAGVTLAKSHHPTGFAAAAAFHLKRPVLRAVADDKIHLQRRVAPVSHILGRAMQAVQEMGAHGVFHQTSPP